MKQRYLLTSPSWATLTILGHLSQIWEWKVTQHNHRNHLMLRTWRKSTVSAKMDEAVISRLFSALRLKVMWGKFSIKMLCHSHITNLQSLSTRLTTLLSWAQRSLAAMIYRRLKGRTRLNTHVAHMTRTKPCFWIAPLVTNTVASSLRPPCRKAASITPLLANQMVTMELTAT